MAATDTPSGRAPVKLILIVLLAAGLCFGGICVVRTARKHKGKTEAKPVQLSSWKLGEFVVNLADRDQPRYLKINLVLEVEGKAEVKAGEGGAPQSSEEAKARDAIITVLSGKRYVELLTDKGKEKLKADLKAALNTVLEGPKVVNVYFTDFAMQY